MESFGRIFQCGIASRSEDQFVLKDSGRICKSSPDGEASDRALKSITNVFVNSFLALKGSAIPFYFPTYQLDSTTLEMV